MIEEYIAAIASGSGEDVRHALLSRETGDAVLLINKMILLADGGPHATPVAQLAFDLLQAMAPTEEVAKTYVSTAIRLLQQDLLPRAAIRLFEATGGRSPGSAAAVCRLLLATPLADWPLDLETAAGLAARATEDDPGAYLAWYARAMMALQQQQHRTAEEFLKRCISIDYRLPAAQFYRWMLQDRKTDYWRSLQGDPAFADADDRTENGNWSKSDILHQLRMHGFVIIRQQLTEEIAALRDGIVEEVVSRSDRAWPDIRGPLWSPDQNVMSENAYQKLQQFLRSRTMVQIINAAFSHTESRVVLPVDPWQIQHHGRFRPYFLPTPLHYDFLTFEETFEFASFWIPMQECGLAIAPTLAGVPAPCGPPIYNDERGHGCINSVAYEDFYRFHAEGEAVFAFEPGDVLIFRSSFPHRTVHLADMPQERMSLDLRFRC